jgi:hypothetical protein
MNRSSGTQRHGNPRWLRLLTCDALLSLVGTGGEQSRATKEGFMCWSPPIQISAVYCTSSSIQTIQSTFLANLVLAPRPFVRLDQTLPVAVTQRYSLLRPIVVIRLTSCYSPPTCTTFQLHESSHEVLRSNSGLFHASLAPLARPKTNQIYLFLTI